ncbi:MAG TPA: hypothetical protein P5243_02605 [Bacteroidales bacterium]|nr:hypothetical protein [Bacteroidales bacterium]
MLNRIKTIFILFFVVSFLNACDKENVTTNEQSVGQNTTISKETELNLCNCNKHGEVVYGGCKCDPGYTGDSCQFLSANFFTGDFYEQTFGYDITISMYGDTSDAQILFEITKPFVCSFNATIENNTAVIPVQYFCVNADSVEDGGNQVYRYYTIEGYAFAYFNGTTKNINLYLKKTDNNGIEEESYNLYDLYEKSLFQ